MSAIQRATLYVRASIPRPVREHVYDVVDDFEALAERGSIESASVETWDARVPVDGGENRLRADAHDVYEAFVEWADETERSLEPYFRVRGTERGEELVLPIMCLAVESEDGVEAVYPSETDDEKRTVPDGVENLKAGRRVAAD